MTLRCTLGRPCSCRGDTLLHFQMTHAAISESHINPFYIDDMNDWQGEDAEEIGLLSQPHHPPVGEHRPSKRHKRRISSWRTVVGISSVFVTIFILISLLREGREVQHESEDGSQGSGVPKTHAPSTAPSTMPPTTTAPTLLPIVTQESDRNQTLYFV